MSCAVVGRDDRLVGYAVGSGDGAGLRELFAGRIAGSFGSVVDRLA